MKPQDEEVAFYTKAGYSVRYLRVSDHGDKTISSLALANTEIYVFADRKITIHVQDQEGETMTLRLKKSTKMEKVINTYALHRGVASGILNFLMDGRRVHYEDTCASLGLEDDDVLEVRKVLEGC